MDYLINIAGEIVTPVGYEKIRNYSEGMACVHNNRNELINIEDYTIMTHCYDYVLPYSDGLALFKKGNKRGFIDKKNKIVIPHSKNEFRSFKNGVCAFKFKRRWGFIDKCNEIIIKPKYRDVWDFQEGFAGCLLYTSPSPRDRQKSRMPSSA